MIHVMCIQLVNGYLNNKRASPGYAIAPQDKPVMRIGFINFYLTGELLKICCHVGGNIKLQNTTDCLEKCKTYTS